MKKGFVIAIDGPSGAGKGTIAELLAEKLNGFYLYTGAMYRSLALYCLDQHINSKEEYNLEKAFDQIVFHFSGKKVYMNGIDVSEKITNPEVAGISSAIAIYPLLRKKMVERQRRIAHGKIQHGEIVIAEGRDTGTKVFPRARFKLFLTARLPVRAKRRFRQFKKEKENIAYAEVLKAVKERDLRDTTRTVSPLVSSPEKFGYCILDNSDMNIADTLTYVMNELKARKLIA